MLCSAITLGRVAWICPEGIAPLLGHFVGPLCAALRHIRDDVEKGHAFLGLCRLLRLNPQVPATDQRRQDLDKKQTDKNHACWQG